MLFLINEQFKKTTKGGKGICRVFLVHDDKKHYWNTGDQVVDITKRMSEIMNREKQFDWLCLTIHYWSGTGFSILEMAIKVYRGEDVKIQNVSIF